MDNPPAEGGPSDALKARLSALGDTAALLAVLEQWGIRSLRQLAWMSPERLGKAMDALPFGSGPSEGQLCELRALNAELWESRNSAQSLPEKPKPQPELQVLEAAAGISAQASRSPVDEEATRMDLEARKAAQQMLGPHGRLVRENLQQHFRSVSQHAFSTMLSHLPIGNLMLAREQARHEPWFSLLTDDVLHTALLRQDWSIRSAFMSGHIPPTNLVPIYGAEDGMLRSSLLAERRLSDSEQSHPRVEPLQDSSPTATLRMPVEPGRSSVMPNLRGFKLVFDIFTKGTPGCLLVGCDGLITCWAL